MQAVSQHDEFQRDLQDQREWNIFKEFFRFSCWRKLGMNLFHISNPGKKEILAHCSKGTEGRNTQHFVSKSHVIAINCVRSCWLHTHHTQSLPRGLSVPLWLLSGADGGLPYVSYPLFIPDKIEFLKVDIAKKYSQQRKNMLQSS